MKKEKLSLTILTILAVAAFSSAALPLRIEPAEALMTTWTVDDDGPADFSSIQAAVNATDNGDTIEVRNGHYHEHITIGKSIKLLGQNASLTIIDSNRTGDMIVVNAANVVVSGFTIQRNRQATSGGGIYFAGGGDHGVYLNSASSGCNVTGNIIISNDYGIFADSSTNNISGNNLTRNRAGIGLAKSSNTVVSASNVLDSEGCAINLVESSNNIISANNLLNNRDGVVAMPNSNVNTISANRIENSSEYGVRLDFSSNNIVSQNSIDNGSDLGIFLAYSSNNWVTSNYIADCTNYAVFLLHSDGNAISANNIKDNGSGIVGSDCSNNAITSNNITHNESGVNLFSPPNNNVIYANNIANNSWAGISLAVSFNSDMSTINNNTICVNNITNNGEYGIILTNTNSNVIFENNIAGNNYGIYIHNASNNIAYHNNLLGNKKSQGYSQLFTNAWDDGYPSGGNYWSDYKGTDANHDGIGDTPYIIDANNQDRYPLIVPLSTQPSTVPTTASVNMLPNPVGIGQIVVINMSVVPFPPTSSDRFYGLILRIIRPDGSTETKGPFTLDAAGSGFVLYTPTRVGNYKLQLNFSGQFFSSSNVTYLPASSPQTTLIVQEQPVPSGTPSPTPTAASTPKPPPSPTPTATASASPTPTPTLSPSPNATSTPAETVIPIPTALLPLNDGQSAKKGNFPSAAVAAAVVAVAALISVAFMLRKLYRKEK